MISPQFFIDVDVEISEDTAEDEGQDEDYVAVDPYIVGEVVVVHPVDGWHLHHYVLKLQNLLKLSTFYWLLPVAANENNKTIQMRYYYLDSTKNKETLLNMDCRMCISQLMIFIIWISIWKLKCIR